VLSSYNPLGPSVSFSEAAFSLIFASSRVQLAPDQEVDAEVNWEDQQNINKFSRLTARRYELENDIKQKKVRLVCSLWRLADRARQNLKPFRMPTTKCYLETKAACAW
jgi:hypothetical protein